MNLTIDNRDLSQVNNFLESRVDALRRALADSQRETSQWCAAASVLAEQLKAKDEIIAEQGCVIAELTLQNDVTAELLVKAMEGR